MRLNTGSHLERLAGLRSVVADRRSGDVKAVASRLLRAWRERDRGLSSANARRRQALVMKGRYWRAKLLYVLVL